MSVHLYQNGVALHATVDVMDFQGTEDPAQVTCETCLGLIRLQDTVNEALANRDAANGGQEPPFVLPDLQGAPGEPPPPDDLESLSMAEHLGLVVASHFTMVEQQRDQARMWATTLEGQLAEAVRLLDLAITSWPSSSWAADNVARGQVVQGIETLKALESPSDTQDPEGDA